MMMIVVVVVVMMMMIMMIIIIIIIVCFERHYIYKRGRILQIHLNLMDSIPLCLIIIHIDNTYTI